MENNFLRIFGRITTILRIVGTAAAPPVARVALALPFLRSGLTRWDPFPALSVGTQFLFENQFRLHLFGKLYALPAPLALGYVTAVAELLLPALLVLGLATRYAAAGLLIMTGVIELIIPDGWVNFHLYWAALAFSVLALGAGPLSFDALISRVRSRS